MNKMKYSFISVILILVFFATVSIRTEAAEATSQAIISFPGTNFKITLKDVYPKYGYTSEGGYNVYFLGLKPSGTVMLSEETYAILNYQQMLVIKPNAVISFDDCEDCASVVTLYVMKDGSLCRDAAKFSEAASIVHIVAGKGSMVWQDSNEYNIPDSVKSSNISELTVNSAVAVDNASEALKHYSGNNAEFNAYYYYANNADLQSAYGANGDALLNHWNTYGKAEGRIANRLR